MGADEDMPGAAESWDETVVPLYDEPPEWMDDASDAIHSQDDIEEDLILPGCLNMVEWFGKLAPKRNFLIPGWIIRGAAGLLSGQEGVGKSLLAQQMATCAALGRNFLGLEIAQVNSVYITCEDDGDELWRRQESINKALGVTMEDLAGKLLLVSLKGELGNELGTFDQERRIRPSLRFRQIQKTVLDFGAGLVVLDNAAHLFTGNENVRNEVAAFLGLLERLSMAIDGAVVLLAHPNKQHAQGNTQGNEYSGSTGWSAHVRNRLFLDWAQEDSEGNPIDDDGRLLRKSKANYGKKGEEIFFRWHEWAFATADDLPENTAAELESIARTNHENETFLRCLRERTKQHRAVSEKPSKSYAPAVFATMAEARGVSKKRLEEAMDRLFRLGAIERAEVWKGPDRKPVFGLRQISQVTENIAGIVAGNVQKMGAENVRETAGNYSGERGSTLTPSTTYIGEPLGGPPSMYDPGDPPDWMDAPLDESEAWRANPLLNPDFGRDA